MGVGRLDRPTLTVAIALLAAGCLSTDLQPSGSPAGPAGPADTPTASAAATRPVSSSAQSPFVSLEPNPTPVPPHDDRFTSVEKLVLRDDHRQAHLEFTGARPFEEGNPCSARYTAMTADVNGVLHIGLLALSPPGIKNCDSIGFGRRLDVDLEAPFGGTAWLDRAGPTLHFLSTPPGLAAFDVPDDWQLVAESDEANGPNGRWSRTYAPLAGAPMEQTLQILQAFDAPADVTGGTETIDVAVAGQPTILYRFPPTGELVLVFEFGGDGLALVADEQVISIPELIVIAESAHAP